MEKMLELGKSTKGLKKVIATKAKKTGLEHHLNVRSIDRLIVRLNVKRFN